MTPRRSEPGQHVLAVLRELDHLVHVAEDAGGTRGDLAPLVGQQHAGARALDEHQTELVLELVDLHGKRRLRDGARFRGAAEMLLAGQRVEVAELFERHMRGHKKL